MAKVVITSVLVYVAVLAQRGAAQAVRTDVQCDPQYKWMTNSHNQNPCLVTAYLLSMCGSNPGGITISTLKPQSHYIGPGDSTDVSAPCKCSTVYFSIVTACAACQGQLAFADAWSGWARLCISPALQKWPLAIPGATAIPAWAYLDVTATDTFDIVNASILASSNPPDTSAVSLAPKTPSATATSSMPYITVTATTTATSQGSTKVVGPVVGGVIGGIALICSAGMAVYILRRRHAAARQGQNMPSSSATETLINSEKMSDTSMTEPLGYSPEVRSHVLYNPDDPSTFPSALRATIPHGNAKFPGYPEV